MTRVIIKDEDGKTGNKDVPYCVTERKCDVERRDRRSL
jgi:hypothetical protein